MNPETFIEDAESYEMTPRLTALVELLEQCESDEKCFVLGWLNADLIADEENII